MGGVHLTDAMLLYLGLTVSLAALVVLYVANVVRTFAAPPERAPRPALSLLPPITPIVAWRAGSRALPILFVAFALAYAILWIVALQR